MFGILSSKRYHVFVRRPADPASRHIDFSEVYVIDSEEQTSPSLLCICMYILHLAQAAHELDPAKRPSTAAEQKWVRNAAKRKRLQALASSNEDDSGEDEDDSDGAGQRQGVADEDDDDADESEGTTGDAGPASGTRSKRHHTATSSQSGPQHAAHQSGGQRSASTGAGCKRSASRRSGQVQAELRVLACLPRVLRPSFHIVNPSGRDCAVRSMPAVLDVLQKAASRHTPKAAQPGCIGSCMCMHCRRIVHYSGADCSVLSTVITNCSKLPASHHVHVACSQTRNGASFTRRQGTTQIYFRRI